VKHAQTKIKVGLLVVLLGSGLLVSCQTQQTIVAPPQAPSAIPAAENNVAPSKAAVIATYVAIAQASYGDAAQAARELTDAIDVLLKTPTETTLAEARQAWLNARVPYLQTEAFRFGNPVVDEWEPRVNSWPLDEGLIDYVAPSYGSESDNNYFYTANIIANPLIDIGGISVDASTITPQLLAETLHTIDGVDANVATGYHAIEFLLWGQDLHGTDVGAGERKATDYDVAKCSNGNCERRRAYLQSAMRLLVADLDEMAQSWQSGGAAYESLMAKGEDGALATMLTGMASLAYGELATERMQLGLLLHSPEEEQDCFSDNTLWSHYYDAKGIANIYHGTYERRNGELVSGASIEALLRATAGAEHAEMNAKVESVELAMQALVRQSSPYDVLIANGNANGERLLTQAINALLEEKNSIEKIISAFGLTNVSIEGSENPAVAQ
jgi:putative iron-regulated protein